LKSKRTALITTLLAVLASAVFGQSDQDFLQFGGSIEVGGVKPVFQSAQLGESTDRYTHVNDGFDTALFVLYSAEIEAMFDKSHLFSLKYLPLEMKGGTQVTGSALTIDDVSFMTDTELEVVYTLQNLRLGYEYSFTGNKGFIFALGPGLLLKNHQMIFDGFRDDSGPKPANVVFNNTHILPLLLFTSRWDFVDSTFFEIHGEGIYGNLPLLNFRLEPATEWYYDVALRYGLPIGVLDPIKLFFSAKIVGGGTKATVENQNVGSSKQLAVETDFFYASLGIGLEY
jgi:hypothetical protein